MEEAWYAEEKVSALEEVDVFIFSSVFVWDYAEWFAIKWGVTGRGWHLDWWTTRQLQVELSPDSWSSLSSPDKRPRCLRRRICQSCPHLCRTSSHRRRQAHCLPGDMGISETQSMMGSACLRLLLLWMFYRNLGRPDGVWVTVGVVVLLHPPPGYLAVLRWPSAGEIISDGPGLSCYRALHRT